MPSHALYGYVSTSRKQSKGKWGRLYFNIP